MYIAVSMGLLLLMWFQPNSTTWEVLQQGKRVKKLEEAMQIYAWLLCLWIHVFCFPVSTCHFLSKILLPAVLLTAHTKPFCHCCKAKWQSNTQQNLPSWCSHNFFSGNNPHFCQYWQPAYGNMVPTSHWKTFPLWHTRVKKWRVSIFFWWTYPSPTWYDLWPAFCFNDYYQQEKTDHFLCHFPSDFILLPPSHSYASCPSMGHSSIYALRTMQMMPIVTWWM